LINVGEGLVVGVNGIRVRVRVEVGSGGSRVGEGARVSKICAWVGSGEGEPGGMPGILVTWQARVTVNTIKLTRRETLVFIVKIIS
jgi:hypothetical protein